VTAAATELDVTPLAFTNSATRDVDVKGHARANRLILWLALGSISAAVVVGGLRLWVSLQQGLKDVSAQSIALSPRSSTTTTVAITSTPQALPPTFDLSDVVTILIVRAMIALPVVLLGLAVLQWRQRTRAMLLRRNAKAELVQNYGVQLDRTELYRDQRSRE